MRSTSGYASIWRILLHQLQPRDTRHNSADFVPTSNLICINPFQHHDTFWRPWETNLLKTLWEKEKLLVTSI